jgi:hypothetical protein
MSQSQTVNGVGRLHRGHRNLGCVGYWLRTIKEATLIVRFDPMPDGAEGDMFSLTLEDGRVLQCQVLTPTYCAVIDGPRVERRTHRRPAPLARALL